MVRNGLELGGKMNFHILFVIASIYRAVIDRHRRNDDFLFKTHNLIPCPILPEKEQLSMAVDGGLEMAYEALIIILPLPSCIA
jgi:hypothetical protein